MKITKIKNIAFILSRELIRDKIFITLSGISILLVLASLILDEMVVGQEIKATKDLGLSVLNLFSLFILIFLGVNLVSKDINSKTLYFLFSKPVQRSEYIIGSSISILMAVIAGILVMMVTIFFLSLLQHENWLNGLLVAGYLTFLEMLLVLAFAILFSLVTSPQLAMFLTLLLYVIGHTSEQAAQIVDRSDNIILKYTVLLVHSLLPNLEFFNRKPDIIYHLPLSFTYFLHATVYSLSYAILIFLFSVYIFKRKEL